MHGYNTPTLAHAPHATIQISTSSHRLLLLLHQRFLSFELPAALVFICSSEVVVCCVLSLLELSKVKKIQTYIHIDQSTRHPPHIVAGTRPVTLAPPCFSFSSIFQGPETGKTSNTFAEPIGDASLLHLYFCSSASSVVLRVVRLRPTFGSNDPNDPEINP